MWAANHWPDAVACHAANHSDVEYVCQDLMQADWRALPDLSEGVLIASPACQGFSSNGRPGSHGRGAPIKHQADRNTAWAVLAACDTARPRTLVVENVPLFADWSLFPSWCSTLEAMGYRLSVSVENAADAGVPQDRRRLIVVGELGQAPKRFRLSGSRAVLGEILENAHGMAWEPIDGKRPGIRARMRAAQNVGGSVCHWSNVDSARG